MTAIASINDYESQLRLAVCRLFRKCYLYLHACDNDQEPELRIEACNNVSCRGTSDCMITEAMTN